MSLKQASEKGGQMQHWDYSIADLTKLKKAVPDLDTLGAEGWEAVGVWTDAAEPQVLMKRLLP